MGAPSDDDPDLTSAPQREIPVDEAWSKGTPAHNDQTSAGLVVDSATLGRLTSGLGRDRFAISSEQVRTATLGASRSPAATTAKPDAAAAAAANPDLDQTTIDAGVTPYGRAPSEDSTVSALDQTMAELEQSDVPEPLRSLAESHRSTAAAESARSNGVAKHDRTRAGLGVAAPARPAKFALLDPSKGTIPLEKPAALLQPERSPLDFVMRDMDPAAPAKPQSSGDSSRFVAAIMDGQPPPRVEVDSPATTAMQPVLRRSRLRRKWIAAGAFAATAVIGTAFAMTLTSAESRPKPAASEVAKLTEDQAPVAATATAPTPNEIATPAAAPDPSPVAAPAIASAEPTVAEAQTETATAPPVTQHVVAATTRSETAAPAKKVSPSAKPAIAKKTVATKDTTDKKSTTKTTSPAKKTVATKDATPKKTATAKKASPDKKKVATKDATAKKTATTKKASPDKKKVATKDAKAKKPSATKKSSPEKKPTAKKTTTKKASRAQHRPRRSRPD